MFSNSELLVVSDGWWLNLYSMTSMRHTLPCGQIHVVVLQKYILVSRSKVRAKHRWRRLVEGRRAFKTTN